MTHSDKYQFIINDYLIAHYFRQYRSNKDLNELAKSLSNRLQSDAGWVQDKKPKEEFLKIAEKIGKASSPKDFNSQIKNIIDWGEISGVSFLHLDSVS